MTVGNSQDLDCEKNYQIQAQLGLGDKGTVTVVRRCAPSSSKPIKDPQLAQNGIACYYEMNAADGNCEKSCYRLEVVQSKEVVDKSYCATN